MGQAIQFHRQKRREPSRPSSPSWCGIRGSIAERVSPQKRAGHKSFLVAVNFQPMCEPQVRHCAMVQAYLGAQEKGHKYPVWIHTGLYPRPNNSTSLCGVYISHIMSNHHVNMSTRISQYLDSALHEFSHSSQSMWSYPGNQLCSVDGLPIRLRLLAL